MAFGRAAMFVRVSVSCRAYVARHYSWVLEKDMRNRKFTLPDSVGPS